MTTPTLASLALRGDIDGLLAALDGDPRSRRDRDVLKWLLAASDLGHEEAEEAIGDVLETGWLHDDGGHHQAAAQWELALVYLEGTDGFEVDHELAVTHLDGALFSFELEDIARETGDAYDFAATFARLDEDAQDVLGEHRRFDIFLSRVRSRIARLERLVEVDAPEVIVEHERAMLREAVDRLLVSPAAETGADLVREARALLAT